MEIGDQYRTAVVIPCLNEALTIGVVVAEFRRSLPGAAIVVVDNASTDQTGAIAAAAGATVLKERRPGKGNAVRKAFNTIEADFYLLVDGDGTYPASEAPRLLAPLAAGEADVVIRGARPGVLQPVPLGEPAGEPVLPHDGQRHLRSAGE